jgi:hypothetical protein
LEKTGLLIFLTDAMRSAMDKPLTERFAPPTSSIVGDKRLWDITNKIRHVASGKWECGDGKSMEILSLREFRLLGTYKLCIGYKMLNFLTPVIWAYPSVANTFNVDTVLPVGTLVKDEHFTLFESVGALEVRMAYPVDAWG